MIKRLLLLVIAAALGATPAAAAQCTVHPNLPINAADCGAVPNKTVDQTPAIQGAINASCGATATKGSPPPVFIPAGHYVIANLYIRCSGVVFYGAGSGGAGGSLGGTRLCSVSGAAPMLTVGTPTAPVARVTLQDFMLSGFCGASFPPGGMTMACLYCHVNRVTITGFNDFGIEFTGAASVCCGFDDVNQAEIQVASTTTRPTYAFRLTGMKGPVGGPDGVSVLSSNVNAGCGTPGNGFIDFVTPGTDIAASSGWIGNRFEANCNNAFNAINGTMQLARFVGNRWENTGSGGLAIRLANRVTIDPPAIFMGNVWACGPGNCSYTDSTGRAVRWQEAFGPHTTSPDFFTSQTAGGGGSAVTLTDQAAAIGTTTILNTRLIPGAGLYRATVSLLLVTAGTAGAISATVGWNNGILAQSGTTETLSARSVPGTEVDGSFLFFSAASQNITYLTTFTGVTGAPRYALRIRLEYVSP
jgi:pectate lyase-like protein